MQTWHHSIFSHTLLRACSTRQGSLVKSFWSVHNEYFPLSNRTLLLHLGYPKSGTTTLQAGLYKSAPGIFFMGKTHDEKLADPIVDRFRTLINYGTGPHVRAQAGEIAAKLDEIWQKEGSQTALLSLEGLTNPFVDTHYTQPKDVFSKANIIAEILDHLQVRLRFLVTVRAQTELLPSLFSQIFLQGFSSGLFKPNYESFLDFLLEDTVQGYGPDFQFDAYLDHLGRLFGPEHVFVAAMKPLLSTQPGRDVDAVADFIGLPEAEVRALIVSGGKKNVRNTGAQGRHMVMHSPGVNRFEENTGLALKRAAFGQMALLKQKRHKPAHWHLSDQSARISAYYAASNGRLADQYGITLSGAVS